MQGKKALKGSSQHGGSAVDVSSVFSTYLYTGNGSTQTINNGIDLAGEGGMVWVKGRSSLSSHYLFDTNRGSGKYLETNSTGTGGDIGTIQTFTSSGFTIGGIKMKLLVFIILVRINSLLLTFLRWINGRK